MHDPRRGGSRPQGGLDLGLWQMLPAKTILRQQEERTAWLETYGCVLFLLLSFSSPHGHSPLSAPALSPVQPHRSGSSTLLEPAP